MNIATAATAAGRVVATARDVVARACDVVVGAAVVVGGPINGDDVSRRGTSVARGTSVGVAVGSVDAVVSGKLGTGANLS
ncbi:MAG TPA: hypothetical protein VM052_05515, partial [Candidatus Limnocylindrales bacterium]|nr:hypothetical protein [Candidatus Limnocylindrales bacterium]